ncbi:DUF6493 family protein [Sphingobacterium lactis]|uniref:DUF6493 family protein n=1 Tax=Sphingobacterium lactis TaxID=797291 RepID=UPI003F7FB30F
MFKHLKYIDGNSDKFWEIQTDGVQHTVTYGRNGTDGQSKTKSFDSEEACIKDAEKLIAEKTKKGYSEDGTVDLTEKKSTSIKSNNKASSSKYSKEEVRNKFNELIKRPIIADIIPFLEEYGKGNMEFIKKEIKAAKRFYLSYIDLKAEPQYLIDKRYTWGQRGTDEQQRWIAAIALASFSQTDTGSWTEIFDIIKTYKDKDIQDILDWAKPDWLTAYMKDQMRKNEWLSFDYYGFRELEDTGHLQHDPEIYVRSMENFRLSNNPKVLDSILDRLIADETFYTRDVPLIFNYESAIQNSYYLYEYEKEKQILFWDLIFDRLLAENKIDRTFIISSSLEIQTKDWNNNLKSYYRDLIKRLLENDDDVINHQHQVFPLFHSDHNAPINFAINLLKPVISHPKFDLQEFINWVKPVFMRTDIKTGVKTLIIQFDKLLKTRPEYTESIIDLVADTFMIPDLGLQDRAAKFILKHQKKASSELSEKLMLYSSQMLGSISTDLKDLMQSNDTSYTEEELLAILNPGEKETYTFAPEPVIRLQEELNYPTDWNEILFKVGEVIHSVDFVQIEILMNAWMMNYANFPEDYKKQLEPFIKQLTNNNNSSTVFQAFVSNFVQIYYKPNAPKYFQEQYYNYSKVVGSFNDLGFLIQDRIAKGISLPLLSLPSHAPFWVAPEVLVDRVLAYQVAAVPIDLLDLAIALSRCPREQVDGLNNKLEQIKNEQIKAVLQYSFGLSDDLELHKSSWLKNIVGDEADVFMSGVWATVARSQYPEGIFEEFQGHRLAKAPFAIKPFRPKIEFLPDYHQVYNYSTKKNEMTIDGYKLTLEFPKHEKYPNTFLYSKDIYFRGEKGVIGYYIHGLDTQFVHSVMPLNAEAMALFYNTCYNTLSTWGFKDAKYMLREMLYPFYNIDKQSCLFLACSCFALEKEVRAHAVETLIQIIESNRLPNESFADHLITLLNNDYGPLGRFADVLSQVKDISSKHNHALLLILSQVFEGVQVKETMPTNFKKLIEIFFDLQQKESYPLTNELKASIQKFEAYKSLNSLLKKILK